MDKVRQLLSKARNSKKLHPLEVLELHVGAWNITCELTGDDPREVGREVLAMAKEIPDPDTRRRAEEIITRGWENLPDQEPPTEYN